MFLKKLGCELLGPDKSALELLYIINERCKLQTLDKT